MSGATTFDYAAALVLELEGQRGLIASDPGGLTIYGLASRWHPQVRDPAFTKADAVAIYRTDYWDAVRGDELKPWLALMVFDAAVQHGPVDARRMLQRALEVGVDGRLGPVTMAAAATAHPGHLGRLLDYRLQHYLRETRAEWDDSGRGWMRRLIRVTRECLQRLAWELAA